MQKTSYSTTINVHPSAARWIEENFPNTSNGYDFRSHPLYVMIQSSLFRKDIRVPVKKKKKQESYKSIKILINEWDFYHFGWIVPSFAQAKISKFIVDTMLNNFCEHIAHAYVYGKVSRDVSIRRILVEYLFDDEEMNYFYLRKYYQRKYQKTGKEKNLIQFKEYTEKIEN
jgi:hypothetical protein